MRSRTILIVSGATLALAACHPPYFHHRGHEPFKTVTTLDCPQAQGDLSRKSASPDGKSCDYMSADGSAVTLRLIALTGTTADSALSPLETSLRAEVPATDAGDGKGPGEGRVDIDLPGIHIHAAGKDGDKDSGEVKIGRGISINGGNTVVSDGDDGGGVDIDAHDKGAEIRVNEGHGGTRRDFILASDTPGPHGYKVAGYEARGPQGGPLVVASLLAKTDDHDRVSHDIHALVRLNVGG
jgi:hypothetical protein